jgi:hypothetical protein
MFEITVTKAIPKFAITTADVSTLEKVAKVIDLTANKALALPSSIVLLLS